MARKRITDMMQTHRFWLLDVVPSIARPFYVLGSPFLGFSNITMPEYTAEVDEIKQVNSMFKKYAYSGGSVGVITLSRGVRAWEDSMWEWMFRALKGTEVTERHLLLLQFTSLGNALANDAGLDTAEALGVPLGLWEGVSFAPGKAWLLWNCIPTRYKAGSDLDAMSGEVSIAELDIQPEAVSEFTLADPL